MRCRDVSKRERRELLPELWCGNVRVGWKRAVGVFELRELPGGDVLGDGWVDVVHELRRQHVPIERRGDGVHGLSGGHVPVEHFGLRELRRGPIFGRRCDRVHGLRRRDRARIDGVDVVRELRRGSVLGGIGDFMHGVRFGSVPSERGGERVLGVLGGKLLRDGGPFGGDRTL